MKTLRDVNPGESVSVVKVHGTGALRRRLLDMGITTVSYTHLTLPTKHPV